MDDCLWLTTKRFFVKLNMPPNATFLQDVVLVVDPEEKANWCH